MADDPKVESAHIEIRPMRGFDRVVLFCPRGHEVVDGSSMTRTGKRLLAGDYSDETCGRIDCDWEG